MGLILHWLLQVIGFHVMIGFPVNYVTLTILLCLDHFGKHACWWFLKYDENSGMNGSLET